MLLGLSHIVMLVSLSSLASIPCDRYQDDWLKISTNALPHWEKAPFEPYALPKNVRFPGIHLREMLLFSSI